jgi:hypothetical protein
MPTVPGCFRMERFELATTKLSGRNRGPDGISHVTLGVYRRTLHRLALGGLRPQQAFSNLRTGVRRLPPFSSGAGKSRGCPYISIAGLGMAAFGVFRSQTELMTVNSVRLSFADSPAGTSRRRTTRSPDATSIVKGYRIVPFNSLD